MLQVLASSRWGGGSQENTRLLAEGLRSRCYQVEIACPPGPVAQRFSEDHFQVWPVDLRGGITPVVRLLRLMRAREYQVVHTHNRRGDTAGGLAAALAGVPLVVTLHIGLNLDKRGERKRSLQTKLHNAVLRRYAKLIIAVSKSTARDTMELLGLSSERVVAIPNGTDTSRYMTVPQLPRGRFRRAIGLEEGRPLVGLIGRVSRVKGHRTILRALPAILEQVPELALALVGEGAGFLEALRQQVAESGLGGHVFFAGGQSDIRPVLRDLDLFVLPSFAEGLPRSMLEAMAAEVPVVASAVDGIPEVIDDRCHGRLVPPGDEVCLAKAVIEAINDQDESRRMALAGKARVLECFDQARVIEETDQVIRQTLGLDAIDACQGEAR